MTRTHGTLDKIATSLTHAALGRGQHWPKEELQYQRSDSFEELLMGFMGKKTTQAVHLIKFLQIVPGGASTNL